jgi:hypothetical protein
MARTLARTSLRWADTQAKPKASAGAATGHVAVPEEYLELVLAAGSVCADDVSPAQIAAQLMALSGFNPNLNGPHGGQGIAQFTKDMWDVYRPSSQASAGSQTDAIPALGSAMCDLTNQLSSMRVNGVDSYDLALAAYQWGVSAVRAAMSDRFSGLPWYEGATV